MQPEEWRDLVEWPYAVGSLGHIRRRRGRRRVDSRLDSDGYTSVTLYRGKKRNLTAYLDTIVCVMFHGGYKLDTGQRPVHLDGLPWNCWQTNLTWGLHMKLGNNDNLVAQWSVMHNGKLQHGPFDDFRAAVAAAQWVGDVLVGRNRNRKIIAYLVNFDRNKNMSPRNPYDKANQYRATGEQHTHTIWGAMLIEAASLIEALAGQQLEQLSNGNRLDAATAVARVNGEDAVDWPVSATRDDDVRQIGAVHHVEVRPRRRLSEPAPQQAEGFRRRRLA